nr:zf-CCHC domain-containing protein/DUF4219 domain-containing protein/UBN2 domain-containing protein [Tanacetum cinerariifolium]
MDQESYVGGCSKQRPPLLEPNVFCFWKARFETYIKSKDIYVWFERKNHFGNGGDRFDIGHGNRIKDVESSREIRNCYGCGSKNHFVDDCLKAKMKKAFFGGAWSDSKDGDQMEKDATCLMAICLRKLIDASFLKIFNFNTSSLQEGRALETGTFTFIFKCLALKQLAIKRWGKYGFVIRLCLVRVTYESVRIDL